MAPCGVEPRACSALSQPHSVPTHESEPDVFDLGLDLGLSLLLLVVLTRLVISLLLLLCDWLSGSSRTWLVQWAKATFECGVYGVWKQLHYRVGLLYWEAGDNIRLTAALIPTSSQDSPQVSFAVVWLGVCMLNDRQVYWKDRPGLG